MSSASQVFILTGMHRSGTSLLGRFLALSGIHMGDQLLEASRDNPHGFYEDVEMLDFQKRLLRPASRFLDRACMWPYRKPVITSGQKNEAKVLIERRNQQYPVWGWKEPRTCLLLNFWAEVIPEAKFLFVFREPRLVVQSEASRHRVFDWNRKKHDRCLAGWLQYNQRVLDFYMAHRNCSVLFSLERAIGDPETFAGLLRKRFAFPFSTDSFSNAFDETILRHRLRRNCRTSPLLTEQADELYQKMLELSEI